MKSDFIVIITHLKKFQKESKKLIEDIATAHDIKKEILQYGAELQEMFKRHDSKQRELEKILENNEKTASCCYELSTELIQIVGPLQRLKDDMPEKIREESRLLHVRWQDLRDAKNAAKEQDIKRVEKADARETELRSQKEALDQYRQHLETEQREWNDKRAVDEKELNAQKMRINEMSRALKAQGEQQQVVDEEILSELDDIISSFA